MTEIEGSPYGCEKSSSMAYTVSWWLTCDHEHTSPIFIIEILPNFRSLAVPKRHSYELSEAAGPQKDSHGVSTTWRNCFLRSAGSQLLIS